MKFLILSLLMVSTFTHAAFQPRSEFPIGPDPRTTPGSFCDRPDNYRYQERIPYCNRDVESRLKQEVFKEYRNLGYRLNPGRRSDYKIDHLIPLCAGGSNNGDNLWPQHRSLYELTDPIEAIGCEKLKTGRIKHSELVELILGAKRDPKIATSVLRYITRL